MNWLSSTAVARRMIAVAALVAAVFCVAGAAPTAADEGQTSPGPAMPPLGLAAAAEGTRAVVAPTYVFNGFLRDRRGRFSPITVPGADVAVPSSINDRGQIVGSYSVGEANHGFLLEDGEITTIDVDLPDAVSTFLFDINDLGEMTGSYMDPEGTVHGFVRSRRGHFTRFDVPGGARTAPHRINDRGQIIGLWSEDADPPLDAAHGFIRDRRGRFTKFDAPGSSYTDAQGLNDRGDIVGVYVDDQGRNRGFLRSPRGRITTIDLSAVSTSILSIDDRGRMVGAYFGTDGIEHGFLRDRRGRVETFDGPGTDVVSTAPFDINARGEIVGISIIPAT